MPAAGKSIDEWSVTIELEGSPAGAAISPSVHHVSLPGLFVLNPNHLRSHETISSAALLGSNRNFVAAFIIRSNVASYGVRRLTSNIVRHLGIRRKRKDYSTSNSWSGKYGGNRSTRIF